jgi:hypothetical protein
MTRAEAAERRSAELTDPESRRDLERIAESWRHLARSYQFVESLERFLLDAEKWKNAPPPAPPVEKEAEVDGQRCASALDPATIAQLSAVYDKVLAHLHGKEPDYEAIAKHIIALAAQGERDPNRLCQGTLARLGG